MTPRPPALPGGSGRRGAGLRRWLAPIPARRRDGAPYGRSDRGPARRIILRDGRRDGRAGSPRAARGSAGWPVTAAGSQRLPLEAQELRAPRRPPRRHGAASRARASAQCRLQLAVTPAIRVTDSSPRPMSASSRSSASEIVARAASPARAAQIGHERRRVARQAVEAGVRPATTLVRCRARAAAADIFEHREALLWCFRSPLRADRLAQVLSSTICVTSRPSMPTANSATATPAQGAA